jgi:hypothetical protein
VVKYNRVVEEKQNIMKGFIAKLVDLATVDNLREKQYIDTLIYMWTTVCKR